MTSRIDKKTRWGLLFVSLSGLGLSLTSGIAACVSQPSQLTLTGGAGGEGGGLGGAGGDLGGAGGEAPSPSKARELFDALEPTMYMACGPGCHEAGGIADMPFLQGPDRYQSIISWPGMIVKDPSTSKLETIPVAGTQHPYKKLDSSPLDTSLYPKIKAWLNEEAKDIVTTGQPMVKTIAPFVPIMGFNAVYLQPLGGEFTGMAITFDATLIGDGAIELSDIQVHPTGTVGVHVVHPLFVVFPVGKQADPDPVDSFSNIDQTFEASQSGTLGPGTLILSNWSLSAKISIAFQKIEQVVEETMDGGADGGTTTTGGCKDVASFKANAQGPLKGNCVSCHGGGNPSAKGAIDMSTIDSDPDKACAQVKNRVNTGDPGSSQLFITTDPDGNAAHPYKFGGSASKFDTFKGSVSQWIQAE